MAELVIDRATWLRGGGDSVLRDPDGNMCCLGFMDRCFPGEIENLDAYPAYMESRTGVLVDAIPAVIRINDDPSLTDAEREQQLTPLLLSLGWDAVRFVGEGHP